MTYFGVLAAFILPPLAVLLIVTPREVWAALASGKPNRLRQVAVRPYLAILAHVLMALLYTTPWDNYLVATGVWWYDPQKVIGIRIGYVPIEEYTFFVVQTLLTGFWTLWLMRRRFSEPKSVLSRPNFRWAAVASVSAVWLISTVLLLSGWTPLTYLTLILSWALIPLLLQLIFGADILLANWRLLLAGIVPVTLYLWAVDALAIGAGAWMIDPVQTTGVMVGVLPVEEMVFFLMTNVIIVFGVTLMVSPASQRRMDGWIEAYRERRSKRRQDSSSQMGPRRLYWVGALLIWLVVWTLTPIAVWIAGDGQFVRMALLGVLAQVFAVGVSVLTAWPTGRLLRVSALVVAITWLVEFVGKSTGVPFGSYAYTALLQPQLGGVPLLIPLAWLMMLFPAWGVAEILLASRRPQLDRMYPYALAALTGLVFTAWDLYLDPQMVARGLWVWESSEGAYFGIPLVNFAGWWLASTAVTLCVRPNDLPRRPLLIVYTLTWLFQAVGLGLFWGQPGPALAGFLGMGIFVSYAWRLEGSPWKLFFGRWLDFSAVQSHTQS